MRRSLLALVLLIPSVASAGWADYAAAFPAFPCSDGWMACVVGGDEVTPELVVDSAGMPAPADLRFSFFTLEPLPAFSPFAGPSVYDGDAVAVVDEPPAEDPVEAVVAVVEPREERVEPPVAKVVDPSPPPKAEVVDPPKVEVAKVVEPVVEPPKQADPPAETTAKVRPKTEPTPVVHEVPVEEPVVDAPIAVVKSDAELCGAELTTFEPKAMLGGLASDVVACLERRFDAEPKQTGKDKISRVLMSNAWSGGDKKGWEKLVLRHFEEVDASDPDLHFKYAQHIVGGGARRAREVIKHADLALERRTVWVGDTYVDRVSKLYKIRAMAAQELWKAAEESHAATPTPDSTKKVEETRAMTKVMAREWYEYLLSAGRDTTVALQLCVSAAGTQDYCKQG